MGLVRWVHLANALFWSASAAVGWWWARAARARRSRRRIYAVVAVAVVLGAESLLQALAAHHPRSAAHLVAEIMLAVTGIVAFFVVAAYGREIVTDERVLYALSRGRLGAGDIHRMAAPVALTQRETEVIRCLCDGLGTEEIATTALRPRLQDHARRPRRRTQDGPGRTTRQRLCLQRDRLTAQRRLFGQVTSRTRHQQT